MTKPNIDTTKPSSARVWNYILGGRDNFEIDRMVGDQVRKSFPAIVEVAQEQRKFLVRAVGYLVEAGIRQFLDIGTGLPTANNTHEVAQRLAPTSKVVYVDNDPLVLAHARALLDSSPEGATDYVDSDVENPARIVAEAGRTLNFDEPVGITMLGILGNVADYAQARSIVDHLLHEVPSGSFLAVSDGTNTSKAIIEGQRIANQSGHPYHLRSPEEITGYFTGLDLVEPGVVSIPHWRPGPGPVRSALDGYCGVGRKP
ncbi:SAM-dependent methyltransferase [Actinoplanes sp. NPDC024001]|uniref:SAM-dependent methyltransferase n=1 Tax=Actinoplanes sp. NPDC024001 TaxID=3154598 RepID=UPI0033D20F45